MRMAQCEGGAGSWQAALARRLTAVFREAFGSEPRELQFVLAPYRLCPLGAHVDHQLGLATGMALDRGVLLAFAPNEAKRVRVRSLDFPGLVEFPSTRCRPAPRAIGATTSAARRWLSQSTTSC